MPRISLEKGMVSHLFSEAVWGASSTSRHFAIVQPPSLPVFLPSQRAVFRKNFIQYYPVNKNKILKIRLPAKRRAKIRIWILSNKRLDRCKKANYVS